jgi:hypothetical protein
MYGAYRLSVGRPEGERPFGRPRCRGEENMEIDPLFLYCDQQLHNELTNYHSPTCFDTVVSSSGSF